MTMKGEKRKTHIFKERNPSGIPPFYQHGPGRFVHGVHGKLRRHRLSVLPLNQQLLCHKTLCAQKIIRARHVRPCRAIGVVLAYYYVVSDSENNPIIRRNYNGCNNRY